MSDHNDKASIQTLKLFDTRQLLQVKYHLRLAGQSADKYLISSFLSPAGQVNTKPDSEAKDGLAAHQVCQVTAPVKHIKQLFHLMNFAISLQSSTRHLIIIVAHQAKYLVFCLQHPIKREEERVGYGESAIYNPNDRQTYKDIRGVKKCRILQLSQHAEKFNI